MAQRGEGTLALLLALLLFLGAVGGTAVWTMFTVDVGGPPPSEGDDVVDIDPEPTPPVECQPDERDVLSADQSTVIDCEPIMAPHNASISNGSIRVTVGSITELDVHLEGDAANSNTNCSGDAGEVHYDGQGVYQFLAYFPGESTCIFNFFNEAGETNATMDVVVIDRPVTDLTYMADAHVLVRGSFFMTQPPMYAGGQPTSWSAVPDLPNGLELRDGGIIIGAPAELMQVTEFNITASNSGGSSSTTLTLTVLDIAPYSVRYIDVEVILTIDEEMDSMHPSADGGEIVEWMVNPPLEAGLEFNNSSGVISGTPQQLSMRTAHFIWANNTGGSDVTVVYITVNDHPVASIDYGLQELDLVWNNDTLDLSPSTTGGAPIVWSIDPPLPQGLLFEGADGRIHGSADTLHQWTNHSIWANNTGGSFQTWLEVHVADMTPGNITWPSGTEYVLEANKSFSSSPVNLGPTIDEWEVAPPLPDGLYFDTLNGVISGSPVGRDGKVISRHAWTVHTVYANNSGGSHETNLTFAIHDLAVDHTELAKRSVGTVDYGGAWPSLILPIGEWAFAVGVDWDDRPIMSAGHAEQGRVAGYGHETMVARTGGDNRSNLSLNALDWVCDGQGKTVGLESSFNGWKDTLLNEGYAVIIDAQPSDLINLDCFVTEFWNGYSDVENLQITDWLAAGGGLVLGGHAWYWSYSNSDVAHNYPGNKIVGTTGLFVSASSGSATFSVGTSEWGDLYRLHGSLPRVRDHVLGGQQMTQTDANIAAKTVNLCVSNLPLDFTDTWGALRDMSNQTGWIQISSSNTFTLNADEVDDLLLNIQEQLMQRLPADELDPHPSSSSFPGPVNASAPRLNRTVTIDGNFSGLPSNFGYANARSHGRMSTGFYAAPGEVVNVTVPASLLGQNAYVLIGAHSDSLWGKTTLSRHPKIVRWWGIDATTIQVGNSFGGPIYICPAAGATLGEFNVTIENVIEMPRYVHGKTALSDWQMALRGAPAPIAELASDWFILTVPSSDIRNLNDPDVAMDFWDEALQMEHNLSGYTPWPRVERAVFDVQISAGWMHSGYPFMAHLASVSGVVNGTYMRQNGDWGMFHELGHNHQWMPSTLPGTTETTCNLYSVKLMTDLVGVDLGQGHGALGTQSRISRTEGYFNGGSQISQWSVWTALETYLQVQEEFGWEPITDALSVYYNMSNPPSGSDAEFNEWVKQISFATGYNMSEFHKAWGFPLTEATENALNHLPVWTTDPLRGWVHEYDPVIRNATEANISSDSTTLDWMIYDNGTNTTWNVCWGTSDGGSNSASWDSCSSIGSNLSVGASVHSLAGLTSGTIYHWRIYVDNGNGRTWMDATRSFTTT